MAVCTHEARNPEEDVEHMRTALFSDQLSTLWSFVLKMVLKCAFPGCPNRQKPLRVRKSAFGTPADERLTFHTFPVSDAERLKLWMMAVRLDADFPLRYVQQMRLCSEHFSAEDFKPGQGKIRRFLKASAVPKLLAPNTQDPSNAAVQLSQDPQTEDPTQDPLSTGPPLPTELPVGPEKCGNTQGLFTLAYLAGDHQTTPVKPQHIQRSTPEPQESVGSELLLVLSTPEPAKQNTHPSTSDTYYALPAVKFNQSVSAEKENAPALLSTCSEVEEMSWLKAIKNLQTPQGANIFKSLEVLVNTQCLLELFKFCWLCHKDCCITIEGSERLFSVTQDCQSCGYRRDWRSHPPSAEPSEIEHTLKHEEVVAQTLSLGNECGEQSHEQVLTEDDGSYLSSGDDGVKKTRKKKHKSNDSSDEWEPQLNEEATDSDVSMDEDLFTTVKEDTQGKLVVWCTQCETKASLSCSVLRHKKVFCCAQCSAVDDIQTLCFETLPVRFDDVTGFQKHAEQEHRAEPFYTLCQDCGKFFVANKEHVCEHKIKLIVCPECGKRFLTEGGLKSHCFKLHSDYDHPCKYCLKVFKTRSSKLEHEQTHPKETQPYRCPDCPQRFHNIHKRNKHVKSHRGPHKYVCDVCKKGFKDINRLRRHKLIHSGEKPFKCQVCERSFNQMENLGAHMRVHTGEKPFTCEECGETFSHNISLKNHKQRHHESGLTQIEVLNDEENKAMKAAVEDPE